MFNFNLNITQCLRVNKIFTQLNDKIIYIFIIQNNVRVIGEMS